VSGYITAEGKQMGHRGFSLWLIIAALTIALCCATVDDWHWKQVAHDNDAAATECEQRSGLVPNQ
jgi:hypothetical protein